MIVAFVIEAILGAIWFGSHAAYNAFNGVSVIFLNLSYVMPIAISLCRWRRDLVGSPFNLGTINGVVCNVVSIGKYTNPHPESLESELLSNDSLQLGSF